MTRIGEAVSHLFHGRDDLFEHRDIDKGMEEEAGNAIAQRQMVARCLEQRTRLRPAEGNIAEIFGYDFPAGRVPADQPGQQLIRTMQINGLTAFVGRTEIVIDDAVIQLRGAIVRRLPGDRIKAVAGQFLQSQLDAFTDIFARIGEEGCILHHVPELIIRRGFAAVLVGVAVHDDHPPLAHHIVDGLDEIGLVGEGNCGVAGRIEIKGNQ